MMHLEAVSSTNAADTILAAAKQQTERGERASKLLDAVHADMRPGATALALIRDARAQIVAVGSQYFALLFLKEPGEDTKIVKACFGQGVATVSAMLQLYHVQFELLRKLLPAELGASEAASHEKFLQDTHEILTKVAAAAETHAASAADRQKQTKH